MIFRRFLLLSILGSTLFGVGFWHLSDGFSLSKINAPLPFDSRWEVESPSSFQIRLLLSQPYTYIGKGSHYYLFESIDKQYILKLFRFSRFHLPSFQEALPLPPFLAEIQNRRIEEKRIEQERLFSSCALAYRQLKEECELVYLHLNKTSCLTQNVTLYDRLKRPIVIPIDHYAFLIQRRGEQIYPYFGRLLKEGKVEEIKKALLSLAVLMDKRKEKGIADNNPEIQKNTGFIHGKAFFLDVAQFSEKIETYETYEEDKTMHALLTWLDSKDPKLASDARIILSYYQP